MNVLLSIKPKYAQAIANGEKLFEFRRKIFKASCIERVYLYASAPTSRVVCSFKVGRILANHPVHIWNEVREFSGLKAEEYFKYFNNCSKGYAIEIIDLEVFADPINPKELIDDFMPPRSFRYIDGQFSHRDIS